MEEVYINGKKVLLTQSVSDNDISKNSKISKTFKKREPFPKKS